MKHFLITVILIFISAEAAALPRFALRQGGTCIDCHTNPTGGTLRHQGGWAYGRSALPMVSPRKDFAMSNTIAENILFGLDFRGQYLALFRENSSRSDFQRMTGSVYTGIALSEKIDVSARYDFIWGIWEAYGTARIFPNESYIKAGTFTPNYGIRLDDHTAYTRGGDLGRITTLQNQKQGLIYEPRYIETGVEVGINLFNFAQFTASAGNSRDPELFTSDPSYTASLQVLHSIEPVNIMVGASASIFRTRRLDASFNLLYPQVQMFGGFAGISNGNFSVMGEYDIAKNYLRNDSSSAAVMIEASYMVIKGADIVVRYDRFDPLIDIADDELSRIVVGLELHPYSFVEIRPQYRFQMEKPEVKNNTFLVQFHFWY
jgi:hypothetical protein